MEIKTKKYIEVDVGYAYDGSVSFVRQNERPTNSLPDVVELPTPEEYERLKNAADGLLCPTEITKDIPVSGAWLVYSPSDKAWCRDYRKTNGKWANPPGDYTHFIPNQSPEWILENSVRFGELSRLKAELEELRDELSDAKGCGVSMLEMYIDSNNHNKEVFINTISCTLGIPKESVMQVLYITALVCSTLYIAAILLAGWLIGYVAGIVSLGLEALHG